MEKGKLPFGTTDFEALRRDGQIYIDKTDLIFELASGRGKIFLSRPRRFGKSLLVSTFESLFKDGLKYFDGLKIAEKWKDTTYGVVKLDFSEIMENETIEDMRDRFDGILQNAFEKVGFVYKYEDRRTCLEQIKAWLDRQSPTSLVLLVDEYDAPLNDHLDNPEFFNRIRNMISDFFLRVKASDRAWRFIFITGIAKFNKSSIFSAFNNLKDISLNPKYGTLLGYTEDEISDNFKAFVEKSAQINHLDVHELMDAMRAKYDGFCFDEEASTHVYAPWSVLSFLDEPRGGLKYFWYASAGKATMVKNYFHLHPLANGVEEFEEKISADVEEFGEDIPISLNKLRDSNEANTLSPSVFLFQAGYLTIKRASPDVAYLNFPNGEVRHAMNRLMAEQLLTSKDIDSTDLDAWRDAAKKGDVEALVEAMNGTFNQIDYLGYPLMRESHVRAAVQICFMALTRGVSVERHYSVGRSDLELDAGDFHWVMEFKYLQQKKRKGRNRKKESLKEKIKNSDELLAVALQQIQEKHYGEGINLGNRKLLRVGLVFDAQVRGFVRYGLI